MQRLLTKISSSSEESAGFTTMRRRSVGRFFPGRFASVSSDEASLLDTTIGESESGRRKVVGV